MEICTNGQFSITMSSTRVLSPGSAYFRMWHTEKCPRPALSQVRSQTDLEIRQKGYFCRKLRSHGFETYVRFLSSKENVCALRRPSTLISTRYNRCFALFCSFESVYYLMRKITTPCCERNYACSERRFVVCKNCYVILLENME